ncbi:MAG: hypothetical protein HYS89_00615 [Candidatus Colwellbacteria bacterium]|nr:hypothetical protein [Candidatus Colwellbacteria bacterium]
MNVLKFSIEARGSGGPLNARPQLVCRTQMSCPVCHAQFEHEMGTELSPRGGTNLRYIVQGSVGFDPGLYCPQCGVLSRVPKEFLDEVIQEARRRVRPEQIEAAVQQMGLQTVRIPGTDDYLPRDAYLPGEGTVTLVANGWDRD